MKTMNAKIGLIITALLVVVLVAYGISSNQCSSEGEACLTSDEQVNQNASQSKLNLKGMTRHVLDFYK